MNKISSLFDKALKDKETKGYKYIYVLVDLHGTILTPMYKRDNAGATIYPYAKEVLSYLTKREDFKLILWTSSHDDAIAAILPKLEAEGIKFDAINENPFEQNTELCCFDKKPYFTIGLDDKFSFNPRNDWLDIFSYFILLGEFPGIKLKLKEGEDGEDSVGYIYINDDLIDVINYCEYPQYKKMTKAVFEEIKD